MENMMINQQRVSNLIGQYLETLSTEEKHLLRAQFEQWQESHAEHGEHVSFSDYMIEFWYRDGNVAY